MSTRIARNSFYRSIDDHGYAYWLILFQGGSFLDSEYLCNLSIPFIEIAYCLLLNIKYLFHPCQCFIMLLIPLHG